MSTELAGSFYRPLREAKAADDGLGCGPPGPDRSPCVDVNPDFKVVGVVVSPEHAELGYMGLSVEGVGRGPGERERRV
jgi:hypothetical protein